MDTTDGTTARRASLAALMGWAARRDRLPEHRANLLAAAWWSGTRNVAELARTADVSRDTVYDDLRSRGIDPKDRATVPERPRPRYEPLHAETVHELAELVSSGVGSAMLTTNPAPLTRTAWALSSALLRIAELLDDEKAQEWERDEMAQDLAARLRTALGHAHEVAADGWSDRQLADRTHEHILNVIEDQAVAGAASITLTLPPDGEHVTVHIDRAPWSRSESPQPEGWTRLRSDSPLLRPELSGAEHLAIQDALDTLAEILGEHLRADGASDEVPPIRICGAPYDGNPDRPCTLPPGHGHHVHQTATGVQWPVAPRQTPPPKQ